MARVLVLDVEHDELREAQCHNIDDFYRELNAEPFDIARRFIGGKPYDIFVDDMGLLREPDNIVVSAVDSNGSPMLVGNLIFTNHDGQGNTVSLTDEDMSHITGCIGMAYTQAKPDGYKVLMNCEYSKKGAKE